MWPADQGLRPDLRGAMLSLRHDDCATIPVGVLAQVRVRRIDPADEPALVWLDGWRHGPADEDIRHVRWLVEVKALPEPGEAIR